jgi:EmrB/QacA subfamily drug resistance transporter
MDVANNSNPAQTAAKSPAAIGATNGVTTDESQDEGIVLTPGRRRLVFAATMATTFMAAIEIHIVATAMPSILPQLGGFHLYSWVFGGFVLAQAVTTPVYGKLADLYGRRRILATGTIVFLLASLLCGLATSMPELIIYRALQGLGAGAILPVAHTIVGDIYTPEERAKVQGQLASVWAIAAIAGPAFGAVIVAQFDWRWVFWINIPLGIVALAMIQIFYRETAQRRVHSIDYIGAILLMLGSGSFMVVVVQGANWPAWLNISLLVTAVLAIVGLVYQEQRAPEPILPLDLLRNPLIAIGMLAGAVLGAEVMVIITFLPAHVQGVIGASAGAVAVALVAMSLAWSAAAAIGGRLMIRTSYRTTVIAGSILLILGCMALFLHTPSNGLVWLTTAATLIGTAMGFSHSTYVIAVQSSVEYQRRGIATSTLYFSRMLGQAVGAAIFGAIVNAGLRAGPLGAPEMVEAIMDPVRRTDFEPEALRGLVDLLAGSLQDAYLVALALAFVVLILATRVPRHLRPTDGRTTGNK